MPMMCSKTMLRAMDLAVAAPTPTGAPDAGIADQHDRRRHHDPLHQAEQPGTEEAEDALCAGLHRL
jgi:hypothetical protein